MYVSMQENPTINCDHQHYCYYFEPSGERMPVDGVVLSGRAVADEAMLTGEAALVPKHPGDRVSVGLYPHLHLHPHLQPHQVLYGS